MMEVPIPIRFLLLGGLLTTFSPSFVSRSSSGVEAVPRFKLGIARPRPKPSMSWDDDEKEKAGLRRPSSTEPFDEGYTRPWRKGMSPPAATPSRPDERPPIEEPFGAFSSRPRPNGISPTSATPSEPDEQPPRQTKPKWEKEKPSRWPYPIWNDQAWRRHHPWSSSPYLRSEDEDADAGTGSGGGGGVSGRFLFPSSTKGWKNTTGSSFTHEEGGKKWFNGLNWTLETSVQTETVQTEEGEEVKTYLPFWNRKKRELPIGIKLPEPN